MIASIFRELRPEYDRLDEKYPVSPQSRYRFSDGLKSLFAISSVPSDTTIRRVLDRLSPADLRPFYKTVFRWAQRQKLLEQFRSPLDGGLLLALDGTQGVSSATIPCSSCLVKQHRPLDPDDPEEPERFTYYHQTLGAALVSPTSKTVLPLGPEPIAGRDEHGVQDSELKAAFRWLPKFRREHLHLQVILLGDALYSNAPFIQRLTAANLKFMRRVKPASRQQETADQASHGERWVRGVHRPDRSYRRLRAQSLNQKHPDLKVNVVQERTASGKRAEWVTNRDVSASQVAAMWQQAVEQGCEHLCLWYQAALFGLLKKPRHKLHFWDEQIFILKRFDLWTWEQLYDRSAKPHQAIPVPDT
ncbi:MAG: hypothetical protein OXH84_00725 [Gammaproteobacteria bacterium]|nr:hypothetical protein [Gammaproteobacteria bacterium]